jgi:hypothetical protein
MSSLGALPKKRDKLKKVWKNVLRQTPRDASSTGDSVEEPSIPTPSNSSPQPEPQTVPVSSHPRPPNPVAQLNSKLTDQISVNSQQILSPLTSQTQQTKQVRDLVAVALERLSAKDRAELLPFTTCNAGMKVFDDLIISAEHKKLQCEQKRWRVNFNGQEVILRDVADKIVHWLKVFRDAGDVAVNFDPVHAALPWAAFRFLLEVNMQA